MKRRALLIIVALLWALGVAGSVIGAQASPAAFFRAWLCAFVFWLGLPLAGVTLTLVHDLSGGPWMASARPALNAAAAAMPLASLSGVLAFLGFGALYPWVHPATNLPNGFYLNPTDFFVRYGVYLILWNGLAAYVLFGPREHARPIAPSLSWISGLGLVALAFSAAFAGIDWILSLEPKFWSSAFSYAQSASWFNTGLALVLLAVVIAGVPDDQLSDLAKILLATTIFWAYVEFIQFLIIWEENLRSEIPFYTKRVHSSWRAAIYVSAALGFVFPFFALLSGRAKRNRKLVGAVCVSILLSRIAQTWLLIMPEFSDPTPFWLDVAALLALGGALAPLFAWGLRASPAPRARLGET